MGSTPTNQMILLEAVHGLETKNPISPLHLRAPPKKFFLNPRKESETIHRFSMGTRNRSAGAAIPCFPC